MSEANELKNRAELDKEREAVNEENAQKYEAAKSRADQIRAAEDILNRVTRNG